MFGCYSRNLGFRFIYSSYVRYIPKPLTPRKIPNSYIYIIHRSFHIRFPTPTFQPKASTHLTSPRPPTQHSLPPQRDPINIIVNLYVRPLIQQPPFKFSFLNKSLYHHISTIQPTAPPHLPTNPSRFTVNSSYKIRSANPTVGGVRLTPTLNAPCNTIPLDGDSLS